jgi:hypothetical protein
MNSSFVLLHKGPNEFIADLSSFRPLCMLDTAGKLLEGLILRRFKTHMDNIGDFNSNQYGFRNKFSTEDAINKILEDTN